MIALVKNHERILRTRERLIELRKQGFKYLVTHDDGDTWIGSEESGIEIDDLIEITFLGEVQV